MREGMEAGAAGIYPFAAVRVIPGWPRQYVSGGQDQFTCPGNRGAAGQAWKSNGTGGTLGGRKVLVHTQKISNDQDAAKEKRSQEQR